MLQKDVKITVEKGGGGAGYSEKRGKEREQRMDVMGEITRF